LPPGHEVVDVQPGAPCHDGQLASGENVVHDGDGLGHVPAHGEVLPGVCHVQHVVGHPLHLLRCGLGGADVHAPVDLHGVCGHHFPVPHLGQTHRRGGFPGGGGAADDLTVGWVVHRIHPLPSTWSPW